SALGVDLGDAGEDRGAFGHRSPAPFGEGRRRTVESGEDLGIGGGGELLGDLTGRRIGHTVDGGHGSPRFSSGLPGDLEWPGDHLPRYGGNRAAATLFSAAAEILSILSVRSGSLCAAEDRCGDLRCDDQRWGGLRSGRSLRRRTNTHGSALLR